MAFERTAKTRARIRGASRPQDAAGTSSRIG